MRETGIDNTDRRLLLLEAVVADAGQSSVAALARAHGIPVASAHRHVAALVRSGYLSTAGYGRHLPGPRLRSLAAMVDERRVLASAATPVLGRLAARTHGVVQLGVLENDMVTYLVKSGERADALFTKVGMQLEAYCSGIGKVLLANLPVPARENYLAGGPFIALTARTITSPQQLRAELAQVHGRGFALDDEEVVEGLQCLAVPVRNAAGETVAAISTSRVADDDPRQWSERTVPLLQAAAREVGRWALPKPVLTG